MNKKSSSQSAFFNFRVLLLLCAVGALLVLAAFGARPGGFAKPQPAAQDQSAGLTQPANNNLSPSGPGLLPRARASSSSLSLMEAPGSTGATVTTDKADYAPGETVVISGTGWDANQAVALHIDDSNGVPRFDESVTADGAGNISNSGFVIQAGDVGLAFTLTATQGTVTAWTQFTDVVGAGVAPNGDPGGFEIDGNLRAGNATPVPGGTDWLDTTSVSGVGGLLFESGAPKDPAVTGRAVDPANCGSVCDDAFSATSGGPLDNPSTSWFWETGASNNKTDMNNAYFHISTSSNGDRWVTANADRFSTNGTAYIDFELLQATLTRNVQTGCSKPPCGNFTSAAPASTGGRTENDILITAQYGNGGSLATLQVFQWKLVAGVWTYKEVTNSIPDGSAFVATSLIPNPPGVPVPYGAFGATPGVYVPNQFVEMSINLSALLTVIGDPCEGIQIKTLMVKTKTSNTVTATLEDMLPPFQVSFSAGFIVSATGTSPACSTGSGTVTGTFSGGIGPFECQLDNGSLASCTSPVTYNNVGSGSHTVTVKDDGATGCQKTSDAVTITIPSAISASETTTPASCHGGNDGSVTVTVSGGSPPYSVTVNGVTHTGVTSSTTFTGLASGTYPASITDAHSCPGTATGVLVGQPDSLVASDTHGTISCHGGTTTVTISATGGTAPYTGTGTFTGVAAGSHTYTVTDANGCTDDVTVTLTQPDAVVAHETHGAILCYGQTTSVTISATGGTPNYTGTGTFQQGAGSHTYTVTDANGCTDDVTVTLTQPAAVVAHETHGAILCYGQTTSVTISATGGTPNYTGTGTFQQGAGSHTYTVTDANGCTDDVTVTLTQPAAVVAHETHGAILCYGQTTSVTISATGGTPNYTGTGTFQQGAGSHTYTVTDANGCTDDVTVTLTQPDAVVAHETHGAILCYGQTTSVTISATGGTPNYTGTGTFQQGAGSHTYTVTDANGCTDDVTVTLTQPDAVVAHETHGAILCFGGTTSVTISATGGTPNYTGTGTFQQGAGSHTYTVTDANGCTDDVTVTLTQPAAVVAHETHGAILCFGGTTSVTISATGGTPNYTGTGTFQQGAGSHTYTVTDANGCTDDVTVTLTQPAAVVAHETHGAILCYGQTTSVTISATGGTPNYTGTGTFQQGAGSHTYTVTDANGCTDDVTVTLTQPAAVVAHETHGAILCYGQTTSVTISATGGTPNYTGTGTFQQGAGSHTYTVTDANGCTSSTTVTLTEPDAVVASNTHGTISCHGGTTNVVISATGGVAPYIGTGTFPQGVGSQTYTVTDANGCTSSTTVTLTEPAALTLGLVVTNCSAGNNGSIRATFGGGTAPYQVKIDGGGYTAATSPRTFTGLAPGSHTITVRDANGCTKSDSITVAYCPTFCSLTQGAYGNKGGKYTYNGVKYTTTQLLQLLTSPAKGGALVVGVPGVRSLTIQQGAVTCLDGDNSCGLARLPANTAPAALPNFGDKTLNACGVNPSCQTNPAIPLQGNGQWQSTLLGQTVTLTLNTRLDPTLPGLVLPSCVSVRPSVLTALNNCGYSQTVGGLLNLANKALAGQSTCGASLSDITNAIDSINTHFDSGGNNNCPSCQQ